METGVSAQVLSGIDNVWAADAIACGSRLPAGAVDDPKAFAGTDHMASDPARSGGHGRAAIGDDLSRINPVDVTARHTPGGHRLESGPRDDSTHGVTGTDHDATRTRGGRSAGTSAEATVDDLHDRRVIATQRLPAGRIIAEIAADGARGQSVQVDRRSGRGLRFRLDTRQIRRALVIRVRVLAPCRAVATELVQVEASRPAAETAVGRVLPHHLAARSDVPRGGLVAGDEVRRVLCDPDAAVQFGLHAGDLPVAGVHRVDDGVHARQSLDLAGPTARPLLVAPGGVVLRLPVEDQDAPVHVSAHIVDEEPGFDLGVAAARVMVDARLLAAVDGTGELTVSVGVDAVGQATTVYAAGPPCGADDDEICRHGRGVDAALPVRDVVSVHVGHRGWRDSHGDGDRERGQ